MEVYGKGILKLQCMNSPLEFLEPISPEKHVGYYITSRGDVQAVVGQQEAGVLPLCLDKLLDLFVQHSSQTNHVLQDLGLEAGNGYAEVSDGNIFTF